MNSSGNEGKVAGFPRHEYESIERAVMESARGRWFLQEFAKRNRSADTLTLLEAIGRLQAALGGSSPASASLAGEIASLAETIKVTRSSMAKIRNDMLPGGGAINDDKAIYDKLADHAKTTAHEIMAGTQRLEKLAGELKAANANDEQTANLETSAHAFQTLAWRQDILSQRIAGAMGLLSHVDDRINAMAAMTRPQAIEPRHLKYFEPDESLFDAAPKRPAAAPGVEPTPFEPQSVHRVTPAASEAEAEPQPAPPAAEPEIERPSDEGKKRIIIIRHARGEPIEIPLAGEVPERLA
jgi:hypothetical protein